MCICICVCIDVYFPSTFVQKKEQRNLVATGDREDFNSMSGTVVDSDPGEHNNDVESRDYVSVLVEVSANGVGIITRWRWPVMPWR